MHTRRKEPKRGDNRRFMRIYFFLWLVLYKVYRVYYYNHRSFNVKTYYYETRERHINEHFVYCSPRLGNINLSINARFLGWFFFIRIVAWVYIIQNTRNIIMIKKINRLVNEKDFFFILHIISYRLYCNTLYRNTFLRWDF